MTPGLSDQLSDQVKPAIRRWRRRRKLATMTAAASLGAAVSYYLDPQNGAVRRSRTRERWGRRAGVDGGEVVPPSGSPERADLDEMVHATGVGPNQIPR